MKEDTVSSVEDDLRSTTESIRADLEELQDIEDRKSDLDARDPDMAGLSEKAESVARRIYSESVAERELADEAAGA